MKPISRKQPGDAITAADFNALVDEVVRLGKISVDRSMTYRSGPYGLQLGVKIPDDGFTRLKINGITSGAGGKYSVLELSPPTSDVSDSGDITNDDLGAVGSTNCIGLDLNEKGRASHSHLNAVNDFVDGTLLRVNDDGTRVYTFRQAPTHDVRFEVTLSNPSGSAGDKTHAPTYVYDVAALNGETLGTGVSVSWSRPVGHVTAAGKGVAYYTAAGSLVLAEVNEVPGFGGC